MKTNRKKRIACSGKVKHKTLNGAWMAARALFKKKNLVAKPYQCKRCGFYHVGKPSYYDDAFIFWNNIFNQMSEYDLNKLKEIENAN